MAKVTKCSCKHKAQDELHGIGNRVCNKTTKSSGGVTEHRCTVCGVIHKLKD